MQYLNEDRKSIGNVYAEMYKPKTNSSVIKENEEFYDIEDHADQLDGDLDLPIGGSPDEDGDYLNDALEEKVYGHMNEQFGETFRRQCDEIKEKFDFSFSAIGTI